MTSRDIRKIYAVEVSPSLISEVTEAVMEDVRAWQSRPLDPVYPIVYLDALIVKMRQEGRVENRAIFVALGVNLEGHKEVLGLWTSAAGRQGQSVGDEEFRNAAGARRGRDVRAGAGSGSTHDVSATDHMYGERQATLEDFAGHIWTLTQTIEDIDPAAWGGEAVNL